MHFTEENFPQLQSPKLSDYNYELPEEKIAKHPLTQRDAAKLLVYNKGDILHSEFSALPEFLPENTLLIFNDTQVVQARLVFKKETGTSVEVFCLNPLRPYVEMSQAMQQRTQTVWKCMIGNAKKWREGECLQMNLASESLSAGEAGILAATLICKDGRYAEVQFDWEGNKTWAEVLKLAGLMPLPPYLGRKAETEDSEHYQTVFARSEGAVAAPTAGLHFTENLLQKLQNSGVEQAKLTLHVGAGTFQPIEDEDVLQHPMHNEQIEFGIELIKLLAETGKQIIPVGTTSLRALESLFWFGTQLIFNENTDKFFIQKLEPHIYDPEKIPSRKEAMNAVLGWMQERGLQKLWGQTEIFIFPPYKFRVCNGLITNFHLPQSTLLLLVAAMIGGDWKTIYSSALENNYRFLSYGDGSLLIPV